MEPKDFLKALLVFLGDLDENGSHQFGNWVFDGKTNWNYGTPGGAWDSEKFIGFRFTHVRNLYDFIIRPVPEHQYLVIESILGEGQLANVDLSKSSKFRIKEGKGFLFEDYTMTVGLGRRKVIEVKTEFQQLGLNDDGLIASFDISSIDMNSLLVDILNWALMREDVKSIIQQRKAVLQKELESKYWWINSLDVFENKILKVGSEGVLALDLLDENRRNNFKQLEQTASHLVFFCAKSLLGSEVFEVELSVSFNSNGSLKTVTYFVHGVYRVEKTISIFLDKIEGLSELKSIKDLDITVVQLGKGIYDVILQELIFIASSQKDRDEVKSSGITGKSHTHRDKNDIDPVLGVKSIAQKLAEQISKLKDEEGQVVGVFGRWGRGKTFLLREMSKELGFNYDQEFQKYDKNRAFHLVKIHAWKYKEERAFWAYLYESVAEQYYASSWLPILGKPLRIFKLNRERLGIWKFLSYFVPLIVSFTWWMLPGSCKGGIIEWFIGTELEFKNIKNIYKALVSFLPLVISVILFYRNVLPKASKLFTTFSKKHSFKDELGFQAKLQDELRILMKTWIKSVDKEKRKRILIVVDDLDRCELNNIVPIADALRIILEEPDIIKRTIVITLVDEKILMNAISRKYIRLGGSIENKEKRAREYMDKLFLTGIKLPDLLDSEIMDILESITKGQVFIPAKKIRVEKTVIEEDEVDESSEFGAESRSSPIESKEKNRAPERKVQIEEIPDNFQITSDEKVLLQKYILGLTNPTPRQLKIFYYRYLLLKLLDQSPEFGLTNKFGSDHFNEFAIYSLVQKQKGNRIDTSDSDQDMNIDILGALGDKFDDTDLKKMESLIEMVVPY